MVSAGSTVWYSTYAFDGMQRLVTKLGSMIIYQFPFTKFLNTQCTVGIEHFLKIDN